MYRLKRFYNQNRRAIIKAILIIVFFFMIITVSINMYLSNKKAEIMKKNEQVSMQSSVATDKSLVSGESVNKVNLKDDAELIEKFLNCCKSNDLEKAYNYLTKSCKEEQFKTIDDFKIIYVDLFFKNTNVLYNIENWFDYTYKITIKENALSTGKNAEYNKQDYISVVNENGERKLNINSYVNKIELNKQTKFDGISIKVIDKLQYMDYTIFDIEIENNTDFNFLLDDLEDIKSVYLQDNNDAKYYLYTHEIANNELLVLSKQARKISLKFYSKYISTKRTKKIVFSNVYLNYGINDIEKRMKYSIEI